MGGNSSKQNNQKDEEEKRKEEEEEEEEEPIDINVEWNCGECTYLNKAGTVECNVCNFKRVLVKRRKMPPPPNKENIPEQTPEQKIAIIEEKVTTIMRLQDIKDSKYKKAEDNESKDTQEEKEDEIKKKCEGNENKENNNKGDGDNENNEDNEVKSKDENENENENKEDKNKDNNIENKEDNNNKDNKEIKNNEINDNENDETIEQHKKRLKIINELLLRQQLKLDEVSGPEIREKRKELTKVILKRMEENDKIIASLNQIK